jgi:hypothetical protein
MITVKKQPQNKPIAVIRAATGNELTNYEKKKLAGIEENAQQNKINAIRVNGESVPVDHETKVADIKLGDLAFKSVITSDDFDTNEYIFIKCELDDTDYLN